MTLTKRKKDPVAGWYYTASSAFFGGIKWHDLAPDCAGEWFGPFRTFGEAKMDAIEYFQTDVIDARRCIAEVKSERKPRSRK